MCSEEGGTLVEHFEDTFENQLVTKVLFSHLQWFDLKDPESGLVKIPDFYAWVGTSAGNDDRQRWVVDGRDGDWYLRDTEEHHWVLCKRRETLARYHA